MAQVPRPVTFQIRPANGGLNTEEAPQSIDKRESPSLLNVRFKSGAIQTRTGFKLKYQGLTESALWIDTVYSAGFQNVIAITRSGIYYLGSGDVLYPINVYDNAGVAIEFPHLDMDPTIEYMSLDVGSGQYDFAGANGGALFPGLDRTDDMMVFCNGSADGIFVIAYTGGATPVEAERIGGIGAPTLGRSVAIYDGRIVVGGILNEPSTIVWCEKGRFDHWDPAVWPGAGSRVLADSPDWIQSMRKLGEYLIVFKERSTLIGSKTGLVDPPFRFDPAPGQGIGLAAPNSIGDLGTELIFLGWDDVYVFSLNTIQPVGTRIKQELFYGVNGILPKYLGNCTGVIAEEFDEYWLFVPSGKWPATELGEPIANLLTNPDISNGTTSWSSFQGTLSAETNGVLGPNALRVTYDADLSFSLSQQYTSPTPDNEYAATLWVRASESASIVAQLVFQDVSDNTLLTVEVPVQATTTFQPVYISGVAPANTDSIDVIVASNSNLPIGGWIELDAAHLVDITTVDSTYIDESSGHKALAYLNGRNEPQAIPFIIDQVGEYLPDTVWCFNYAANAWSVWRLPMTGFGYDALQQVITLGDLEGTIAEQTWRFDGKTLTEFAPTNLIGQPDGQVYEISSLAQYDYEGLTNYPIPAYWESKDFDLGKPTVDKTFSRLSLFHEVSHAPVDIEVGVSTDSGNTWQDQTITVRQGHTQTIVDFFVTGPQARFRVNATGVQFFFTGFEVKLIPRGEYNAY